VHLPSKIIMMSGVVNVVETLAEYDILEFAIDDRYDPSREVGVDVN